ncbi:hypothetical protein CAOG_05059 [Capsaspora owczarzaki ATCC 30864]|uniref:DUF11 domain-containing protein n=1 Tax=Capsaspora owczarzaki (strain ATCC 30864) TaxID=595528 RepID=A0A0D2UH23_CAPO3|nr:hypothetical protein CAOG_05059 [Capsaspora owczarzaki ATCC 30864]KJE94416.1 hypothetical protein CAOG_005059 [Capsaspora owczarzaki ATCC 30864]|eukprot:XP_004346744.2 hypothetical protein CAOG_05059 [Capsaspora owczarzaki ATCC 30864]
MLAFKSLACVLLLCSWLSCSALAGPISADLSDHGVLFRGEPTSDCASWSVLMQLKHGGAKPATMPSVVRANDTGALERHFGDYAVERLHVGENGAEHTITLNRGPSSPFAVEFSLSHDGIASALISDVDGALEFTTVGGCTFRYEKLEVIDATGRKLAARMSCTPSATSPEVGIVSRVSSGPCAVSVGGAPLPFSLDILEAGVYPILIDPFVADNYPIGAMTTQLFSQNGDSVNDYFGAQIGSGNFWSSSNAYADLVVSAPGYSSKRGTIYGYKATGSSLVYTSTLASGSCVSNGNSYGFRFHVGRAPGASFDTVFSGTQFCSSLTAFQGSATGPSRTISSTSVNCNSYAIGQYPICGVMTYYGEPNGGSGTLYVSSSSSWSSVSSYSSSSLLGSGSNGRKPGLHVYTDYQVPSDFFFADPAADTPSGGYLGRVVGVSSTGSRFWAADGPNGDSGFGRAIILADVDGNGARDLIIGVPHMNSPTRTDCGGFRVYLNVGGSAKYQTSPAFTAYGEQDAEECGSSLSNVGDLNRDGFQDVVMGCPYYSFTAALFNEGRIFLFNGKSGGAMVVGQILRSNVAGSLFGYALSTTGRDHNSDAYADLAVGMPGTNQYTGRAVILAAVGNSDITITLSSNRGSTGPVTVDTSVATFTVTATISNAGPEATLNGMALVWSTPTGFALSSATISPSLTVTGNTISLPAIADDASYSVTLSYTLLQTVQYPNVATFSASIAKNPPRILTNEAASLSFKFVSQVTISFITPPKAFQEVTTAPYTTPSCTTGSCQIVKGKQAVLRNFGFRNTGTGTAFGNQLTITSPAGVVFNYIRKISDQSAANLATLGWSCSSTGSGTTTKCVFPNLVAAANTDTNSNTNQYELVFSTAGLATGGSWAFQIQHVLGTTPTTSTSSNNLVVPAAQCDLAVVPSATYLAGGSCCGGASTEICVGATSRVTFYVTNQGLYSSAATSYVTVAVPASLAVSAADSYITSSYNIGATTISSSGACTLSAGTLRCNVPGDPAGVVNPDGLVAVTVTMNPVATETATSASMSVTAVAGATVTDTNLTNNVLPSFSVQLCKSSILTADVSVVSSQDLPDLNGVTGFYSTSVVELSVNVKNNGPAVYVAGSKSFTFTYDSALTVTAALSANPGLTCSGSGAVVTCVLNNAMAVGAQLSFSTRIKLTSPSASAVGPSYQYLATSTVQLVGGSSTDSAAVNFVDYVNPTVFMAVSPSTIGPDGNIVTATVSVTNPGVSSDATNVRLVVSLPYAIGTLTASNIALAAPSASGLINSLNCAITPIPTFTDFQSYTSWIVNCTIPTITPLTAGCDSNLQTQRCRYELSITAPTVASASLLASAYKDNTVWPFAADIYSPKPDDFSDNSDSDVLNMATTPQLAVTLAAPSLASLTDNPKIANGDTIQFQAHMTNFGTASTSATITIEVSGSGSGTLVTPTASLTCSSTSSPDAYTYTCTRNAFTKDSTQTISFGVHAGSPNGQILVKATVTSSVAELPTDTADNTVAVLLTNEIPGVDLALDVFVDSTRISGTGTTVFNVAVSNINGPSPAKNVTVVCPRFWTNATQFSSIEMVDDFGGDVSFTTTTPAGGFTTLTFNIKTPIAPLSTALVWRVPFSFSVKTLKLPGARPITFDFETSDKLLDTTEVRTASVTLYYTPVAASASSEDSSSIIGAIVGSILGVIVIALIAWKLGFFDRKAKPPALDGSGNPKTADDD